MARAKTTSKRKKATVLGRPPKFKPEYVRQARLFALLGATNERLAEFLEVSVDTIYEWMKVHPAFSEALKSGKDEADSKVARALYKRATGFSRKTEKVFQFQGQIVRTVVVEHFPPDPTSCFFWLKNRQSKTWRDAWRNGDADSAGGINVYIDADTMALAGATPDV